MHGVFQLLARAKTTGLTERVASGAHRRAIDITLTVHGHDLIEQTVDRNLTREASLLDELARTIGRHLPAYSTDSITSSGHA